MGALAAGVAVLTCFAVSKDLVVFLEAPVASQGVRFLQLSPGEFFFTTLKVRAYRWAEMWQSSPRVCSLLRVIVMDLSVVLRGKAGGLRPPAQVLLGLCVRVRQDDSPGSVWGHMRFRCRLGGFGDPKT